jgi:hypothetical protein
MQKHLSIVLIAVLTLLSSSAHAARICGRMHKTRSDWASRGARYLYDEQTDKEFFFHRGTVYDSHEDHKLLVEFTNKRNIVCVTGRYIRQSGGNNTRYDFETVHSVEVN